MNAIRRILDVLVERFVASVGSLLAARVETVAALLHAEQQDELEQRARQFEVDGKQHLAEDLRWRAAQLAQSTPGAGNHELPPALSHQPPRPERPRIAQVDSPGDDAPDDNGPEDEPTTRRPKRRRSCHRGKTS